jgi:hypothetical protein
LLVAAELKTSLHQIWHDYSFRQGRYFRKVRTPKIVIHLSPNERDSCNLETKDNRRTKQIVSEETTRREAITPDAVGLNPGEDGFCS